MAEATIKYKSILYIDDDSDDCQLVADAITEIDQTINVAFSTGDSSFEEEIQKLDTRPDLVIVAVNRPSESEILRFMKYQTNSTLSRLPFFIFSSTKVPSIVDAAFELGVKSFIVKPSDFKVLKSLLKSVLSHQWAGESQLKRKNFVVTDTLERSRTCFMIDDDLEDRTILLNALNELYPSLPCQTAFDGEDALKQIADNKLTPDIIFLDLNMPRMDGIECLRAMRSMHVLDESKIIVFTVSTNPEDMEITKALGANYFVTKPPDFDSLVETLSMMM